nr:uncharacterized protein LOC114917238 [Labrus bergylta]
MLHSVNQPGEPSKPPKTDKAKVTAWSPNNPFGKKGSTVKLYPSLLTKEGSPPDYSSDDELYLYRNTPRAPAPRQGRSGQAAAAPQQQDERAEGGGDSSKELSGGSDEEQKAPKQSERVKQQKFKKEQDKKEQGQKGASGSGQGGTHVLEAPLRIFPGINGDGSLITAYRPWTKMELKQLTDDTPDPKKDVTQTITYLKRLSGCFHPCQGDWYSFCMARWPKLEDRWRIHLDAQSAAAKDQTEERGELMLEEIMKDLQTKFKVNPDWGKLSGLHKREEEQVEDFVTRLQNTFKKYSGLTSEQFAPLLPRAFVDGLERHSREVIKQDLAWEVKTLEQCVAIAKHLERNRRNAESSDSSSSESDTDCKNKNKLRHRNKGKKDKRKQYSGAVKQMIVQQPQQAAPTQPSSLPQTQFLSPAPTQWPVYHPFPAAQGTNPFHSREPPQGQQIRRQ